MENTIQTTSSTILRTSPNTTYHCSGKENFERALFPFIPLCRLTLLGDCDYVTSTFPSERPNGNPQPSRYEAKNRNSLATQTVTPTSQQSLYSTHSKNSQQRADRQLYLKTAEHKQSPHFGALGWGGGGWQRCREGGARRSGKQQLGSRPLEAGGETWCMSVLNPHNRQVTHTSQNILNPLSVYCPKEERIY